MDGLSSAASAMAVISLAFQMAETAKRLCDFWSSIKDAPEDVRTINADLELLTSVLAEMAFDAQRSSPDSTLAAVLQSCTGKLKTLTALTNSLEPGFSSSSSRIRKWTAFQFVLKSEKLRKYLEVLESLKSTLVLAQQNRHNCLSRMQHETQLEKMTTIAQKLDSLSLQHSVALVTTISKEPEDTQNHIAALRAETIRVDKTIEDPLLRLGFAVGSERALHGIANEIGTQDAINEVDDNMLTSDPSDKSISEKCKSSFVDQPLKKRLWRESNTINYFFGTIHTHSMTKQLQLNTLDNQESDDAEYCYEHESFFTIRPAAWLIKLGLNSGFRVGLFNSSVRGWKSSLDTFCAVPDDSLIFDLSRDGNLSAVRNLFSRGLASVRDTNSMGETPLHVAAANHHPKLCRFLIAAGADKSLRSQFHWWNYFSPIMAACWFGTDQFQASTAMDTIRLFTAEMDFIEADGDGWAALACINDFLNSTDQDPAQQSAKSDLLLWLLQLFSQEIRANFVERHYARVLKAAFRPGRERVARLLIELGPVDAVDAVGSKWGYSTLQRALVYASDLPDLEWILEFNPDIHHLGFEPSHSPVHESPLSVALYASQPFRRFADALSKRNTNLDEFVLQELRENSLLMKDGWTRQSLRALFDHKFEPDVGYTDTRCCDECGDEIIEAVQVEIAWQYHLKEFKEWHLRTASEKRRSHMDLVGNIPDDTLQHQTSMGPTLDFDDVGNYLKLRSSSGTDCCSDAPPGSEPAEDETDEESWERRFWRHEVVCVHCWHNFAMPNDSTEEDNDSDDDFSPYLFNT